MRHDLRLTILGDLTYGGPRRAKELGGRIGLTLPAVAYHLAVLRSHGLTVRNEESDLYVASLTSHPPWVEEAVAAHRLARRIGLGLPEAVDREMTCTFCGRLLRLEERTVAIYGDGGSSMTAEIVTEGTLGNGGAEESRATAKYHHACYEAARREGSTLPPLKARP